MPLDVKGVGSALETGGAIASVVPGIGTVVGGIASVFGGLLSSFDTKSVAGMNRTLGRFFRAGAPCLVGTVVASAGGTGAQQWSDAVALLGIETEKGANQTKEGYTEDAPKDRYGKDSGVRPDYSRDKLVQWLKDVAAGKYTSALDPSPQVASIYNWRALLSAWGVNLQTYDAQAQGQKATLAAEAAAQPQGQAAEVATGKQDFVPLLVAGGLLLLSTRL